MHVLVGYIAGLGVDYKRNGLSFQVIASFAALVLRGTVTLVEKKKKTKCFHFCCQCTCL
jgi:hypothetical protein